MTENPLQGAWTSGETAGGFTVPAKRGLNPQFLLQLHSKTTFFFSLKQEEARGRGRDFFPISAFLLETPNGVVVLSMDLFGLMCSQSPSLPTLTASLPLPLTPFQGSGLWTPSRAHG